MTDWQNEFNMFAQEALEDMKTYSDNTNEEREWMCYVYLTPAQTYELGGASYGDESAIKVSPQTKGAQDRLMKGLEDQKWIPVDERE